MKKFKKFTEITDENHNEACRVLEKMGDEPGFEDNVELQKEADKLEKLIVEFCKVYYPIEKPSPKELEKLKKAYRKIGGNL